MGNKPFLPNERELDVLPISDLELYRSTDKIKVGAGVITAITSKLSQGYIIYTFWANAKARLTVYNEKYVAIRKHLTIGKPVVIKYTHLEDYLLILDVLPLPQYTVTDVIVDFLPIIVEGTLGENANTAYSEVILEHHNDKITLYIPSEQIDTKYKDKRYTLTFSMIGAPHVYVVTNMVIVE